MNLQRHPYFSVSSEGVPIRNIADYSPFGVQLDGRTISGDSYRYGYQGSEKDDESKGGGNSYMTFFRQLDPRVGRWFSVDPVFQPWQSPYCSMDGNPISYNDILGNSIEPMSSNTKKDIDGDIDVFFTGKKGNKDMVNLLKGTFNSSTNKFEGKIDEKAFKKASKSLSFDQQALAIAYKKTIEDNKTIQILGVGNDEKINLKNFDIPSNLMQEIESDFKSTELTINELGVYSNPNSEYTSGLTIGAPENSNSGIGATVFYNRGVLKTPITVSSFENMFKNYNRLENPRTMGTYQITTRGHELFGHASSIIGIYGKVDDNVVSIQIENLMIRILKTGGIEQFQREGSDHEGTKRIATKKLIEIPEAIKPK